MALLPLSTAPWTFRDVTRSSPWRPAVVPGCIHRDLLRHKLIPDPFWASNEAELQWIEERDWEYRCRFRVTPALLCEEVVELVADGLDTVATVTLNGQHVGGGDNMFIGYRWDVKALLRPGANELVIRFGSAMNYIRTHRTDHTPREINDPVGGCTVIRKQQCQFGWDWGPRLVTAGIWRDIRLEGWSTNRLESVRVTQVHRSADDVTLELTPELVRPADGTVMHWRLHLGNTLMQKGEGAELKIQQPQLWWPSGHGPQALYLLEVEVKDARGQSLGTWIRRIGLRTVVLERKADEWGESFRFVVNGRPLFAKGANWIPAHSFVAGLTRADYERELRAAADANMNMIRVWGGGIYESDDFYDLCDELGLLVWQDFMFACTLYPADSAFLESSGAEATFQARRLRHRASLALWCGNNEVLSCNPQELAVDPKKTAAHDTLFLETLHQALRAVDRVTSYWPSSPWRGDKSVDHATGEKRGDTHFWDVWHARMPVKEYEKYVFRFVSEFGMQSFSSPETNATFCPAEDANVFGHSMENHQKNRSGNQIILDYVSRRYCFPKNQDALIYLSQLNQAYCMQTGVEQWRRNSPRCMGALYWQLNDCWPTASWSSIEFTGRWRALHHVARRFFAPALVTAYIPGEETTIIGNYRRSNVHEIHLYTVYDAPEATAAVLRWDAFHLDGRSLARGRKSVVLRYGESQHQHTVDCTKLLTKHTRDSVYLRIRLEVQGESVSEETVFLTAPRFLNLPTARTTAIVRLVSPGCATITFRSNAFQHRFAFDLRGLKLWSSDNFFELYPDENKTVVVKFPGRKTASQLKKLLTHQSLVDTY